MRTLTAHRGWSIIAESSEPQRGGRARSALHHPQGIAVRLEHHSGVEVHLHARFPSHAAAAAAARTYIDKNRRQWAFLLQPRHSRGRTGPPVKRHSALRMR